MQTYSKQGYLYKRSSTFLGAVEILRGFPNPQVRKDFQRPRCACWQHIESVFSDYKSSRRGVLAFPRSEEIENGQYIKMHNFIPRKV